MLKWVFLGCDEKQPDAMRWKSGSFPVRVLRKSSCCDPLDHIIWLWSIDAGLTHWIYGAIDITPVVEEVCEVFGEKVREYGLKNEMCVYVIKRVDDGEVQKYFKSNFP